MLFALLSLAISTAAECFNSLTNFNDFPKTADEEVCASVSRENWGQGSSH